MKKIPLWLYLLTFFLIPHIRWLSPLTSSKLLGAAPFFVAAAFVFSTPLLFQIRPKRLLVHYLVVVLLLAVSCLPYLDTGYWAESSEVYILMFSLPIVGLGAPLMMDALDNRKFARAVILVLALACLVQSVYMAVESVDPTILRFVRPNAEGADLFSAYSNRYGTSRTMYTLTDPMSAGSWAWFTGITLLVLAPLARFSGVMTLGIQALGAMSIGSILFTLSRGPAAVAVISILTLLSMVLTSLKRIFVFALLALVVASVGLNFVLKVSPQFANSVVQLAADAFSGEELGNAVRLDAWSNGINSLSEGGNGLQTISFMQGHQEVNFENTFLNLVYAAGIQGLLYSLVLILAWIVFTLRLGFRLYHQTWKSPQDKLRFAWAVGWFSYLFMFPCLRNLDCAFITFTVLGALIFPTVPEGAAEVAGREKAEVRIGSGFSRVVAGR